MIKVTIVATIDGVQFSFEKEVYSTKVAGGQESFDVDRALELMRQGYNKVGKALESQR